MAAEISPSWFQARRQGPSLVIELHLPAVDNLIKLPRRDAASVADVLWPQEVEASFLCALEYCIGVEMHFRNQTLSDAAAADLLMQLVTPPQASPLGEFIRGHWVVLGDPPAAGDASAAAEAARIRYAVRRAWASFTARYFAGTDGLSAEKTLRVPWLQRLVGRGGWQEQGEVRGCFAAWANNTAERLQKGEFEGIQAAYVEIDAGELGKYLTGGFPCMVAGGRPKLKNNRTSSMKKLACLPTCCSFRSGYNSSPAISAVRLPSSSKSSNDCRLGYLATSHLLHVVSLTNTVTTSENANELISNYLPALVMELDGKPAPAKEPDALKDLRSTVASLMLGCALSWRQAVADMDAWAAAARAMDPTAAAGAAAAGAAAAGAAAAAGVAAAGAAAAVHDMVLLVEALQLLGVPLPALQQGQGNAAAQAAGPGGSVEGPA